MMYMIVKVVGLPPNSVPRLHAVFEGDNLKSKKMVHFVDGGFGNLPFAELLSCRLDKDNKTYTAEIKVFLIANCHRDVGTSEDSRKYPPVEIATPVGVMTTILGALGDNVLPAEEQIRAKT